MDRDDIRQVGWELRLLNGAGLLVAIGGMYGGPDDQPPFDGQPDGRAAELRALVRIAMAVADHSVAAAALPAVVLTPTGAARIDSAAGVTVTDDADAVSALAAAGTRSGASWRRARAVSVFVSPDSPAAISVSVSATGRAGTALTRRLFRATAQALLTGGDHASTGASVDADALLRPAFDFGERSSDESSDD